MPFLETNDRTQLSCVAGGTGKPVVFMARPGPGAVMWQF